MAHRLRVAGAVRPIFEPDGLATLHELTHGIARQINRLCDLALLIGFAEERQTADAPRIWRPSARNWWPSCRNDRGGKVPRHEPHNA